MSGIVKKWGKGLLRPLLSVASGWLLTLAVCAPVLASGSGPLAPFPITGAYTAQQRLDKDDISVIDLTGSYDIKLGSGQLNAEPRAIVSRAFLKTHPDNYDFIVTFSTFNYNMDGADGYEWGVQNHIKGLGLPIYDNTALFGSKGRLHGFIDMGPLSQYSTDPLNPAFEKVMVVLAHEMLHAWGIHVHFKEPDGTISDALLGRDDAHWSFLADTDASVEYGADWRDNGNGTFTAVATQKFYSPMDLYLMGFYKPQEVPPFFIINNPSIDKTRLPDPGVTISGTKQVVTVNDVIAAEGPRVPSEANSQKVFRIAFVLLTTPGQPVDSADIAGLNRIRNAFMTRFAVLTGGRGIARIYPEAQPVDTTGTPTTVGGGTLSTSGLSFSAAFTWLRQAQQVGGNWSDKPATGARDTAVALSALSRFDTQFTGTASALSWLNANAGNNSDYIARHIALLTQLGGSPPWDKLVGLQNTDGGWGFEQGYASDPLDTALAVQALSPQATFYKSQIAAALQYLQGSQNADGGWGSRGSTGSRVGATVAVLKALHALGRDAAPSVATALTWLAGKQNADGGFGDSPSTVPNTASALQLLVSLNKTDLVKAAAAAQYLVGQQNTDGSWSESSYATALAVSALEHYSFPNWAVKSPPSVSPSSPNDGQRVTLSVSVTNDAQVGTPQGVLRFYDGDPNNGGTPIGSDITIPPMSADQTLSFTQTWDTLNKAGAHTIYAVVDPDNQVTEMSKKDNSASTAVTVKPAPAGIDLEVTNSDIAIAPIQPDILPTSLGITANVRNLGLTDAKGVQVALWDGPPGSGSPVATQTVDVLNRSNVVVNFPYDLKKPGTTTFTVQVDPNNAIVESDENNNEGTASVTTAPSVDLSVATSDISIDKSAPNVGDDVTFTVNLHNNGTEQSPAADVHYYVTDGTNTVDLGTNSIQIGPGQSIQQTVKWRVTLQGSLHFVAVLDPNNSVTEVNESNNQASLPFTSTAATGVNLAVSYKDLTFNPNPGLEAHPLTISALVRNTGTVAADNVEVAFYNGDPSQGGTQIGATQVIPSIAAGGSATASITWPQIPDASDKLIFVVADPANKIVEFTKADNTAFNVLSVLSLPDLAISAGDITLNPAFPKAGDTLAIAARVSNLGQQGAQNVVVRAYDGDPSSGGVLIGEQTIASLAGGKAATVNFSYPLPSSAGSSPIVIEVDPDDTILERNKSNNVASKDVAVQNGNFYVTNRYFSPNGDGVKDSTQLFFRLAQATDVTVDVVNSKGTVVRTLGGTATKNVSSGNVTWDGLDKLKRLVPDGDYQLEVKDASGTVLGQATTTLDTNRSSLLKALNTKYERYTNLTCPVGNFSGFQFTKDEGAAFFYVRYASSTDQIQNGIYEVSPDGSDIRTVVPASWFGTDSDPSQILIAPDGSRVFFVRYMQTLGEYELWSVNADGSHLVRLDDGTQPTNPFDYQNGLAFVSPDGKTVYVTNTGFNGSLATVGSFSVDSPGTEQIVYSGTSYLAGLQATKDGAYAAGVEYLSTGYQVIVLNTNGGQAIPVGPVQSYPPPSFTWSPDGTKLAVSEMTNQDYAVYDTAGNLVRSFPIPSNLTITDLNAPAWSSDSSAFAVRVNAAGSSGGGGYGDALTPQASVTGTTNDTGGIFVANMDDGTFKQVADVQGMSEGGSYHISTWNGSSWVERGVLHYDRFSRTQQLDLSKYLPDADGEYKVRIHQIVKPSAQIDSVALVENGNRFVPTSAHEVTTSVSGVVQSLTGSQPSDAEVLDDIRYPDNQVLDSHDKTFEVKWNNVPKVHDLHLSLTAREEDPSTFKALPFTYAGADGSGYSYTLGQGAPMKIDGLQTADDHLTAPLFSQFSRPTTGHPPATVYGYVSNDANYLYGALDFTVDNTREDNDDWASIRVQTPQGLKTFKVDASDTTYGIAGFTKTGKVSYTHRYYEFKIPLSQLGLAPGDQTKISFQGYGSAGIVANTGPVFLPSYGDLLWAPDSRTLLYMSGYAGNWSIELDNGNKLTSIFDKWPSDISPPIGFSPTGRKLMFTSGREAQDPTSVCYQKGYTDEWTFESLLNLVADLRAVQSPQSGGIILRGTATDLNFDSYSLDYAPVATPNAWQPVAPASNQEVVDDVFTTWVPPGPGSYFVRLTVRDLAGNQRQVVKRVSWGETASITDLYRTPPIISPNGDGVQDVATIHYRVLAPVHLSFQFYDTSGTLVRTIEQDETVIGSDHTLNWDGRDDNGLPLPDGTYHMKVQNYDFSIKIDTHSPALTLALSDPYQYYLDPHKNKLVAVGTTVSWSVSDPNYKTSALESGAGSAPSDWAAFQAFDPTHEGSGAAHESPLTLDEYTGHSFRLSASDEAGNQNSLTVPPGPQDLIVYGFGSIAENPAYYALLKEAGPAAAAVSSISLYAPVSPIPWAPMGDTTDLTPIGGPVDLGDARFTVAETIASPITQLYVQYREKGATQWQEAPLTQYLTNTSYGSVTSLVPNGILDVKWHMAGLKANAVYDVRLHATTADGSDYFSNAFAFTAGGYVFQGLYSQPVSPPLAQGETALWGQEFLSTPIGEASVYVYSPAGKGEQTDDRYLTAQQVATVANPNGTIIFRTKDLQACKSYIGYMELYGPVGPDGTRTLIGRTNEAPIEMPCLKVKLWQQIEMAAHCGDPSPNHITIHMTPTSMDGTALKLMTLSTVDANNNENVVYNVNQPASGQTYNFDIDTTNLPEGTLNYRVHLLNDKDAEATQSLPVLIDHTPATASISYPLAAQRVCGVPMKMPDGTTRDSMTFEGVMDDANGYHYTMDLRKAGDPTSAAQVFEDSRSLDSLAGGKPINPPYPDFHITQKTDGPIGAIFDKSGDYTARLHVFDRSGSQVCVERTFYVDSLVQVGPETIDHQLISPNGDGVLDDTTITHDVSEPITLDVQVYPATRDPNTGKVVPGTSAVRQLVSGSQLLAGTATTTWDGTNDAGQVVPDGLYAVVSTYTDGCGNKAQQVMGVEVDDTPPQLGVSSPQTGQTLPLMVEVDGTVSDAHLQGYAVDYGVGTAPTSWVRINGGTSAPADGVLANWNTYGLVGSYVLRLSATDTAGNHSELKIPLTVTAKGDLLNGVSAVPGLFSPNGDGKVDTTAVQVGVAADVNLTVAVVDAGGTVVRTLMDNQAVSTGAVTLSWDGKDDSGTALPDGDYTVRASAVAANNPLLTQEASIKIALDNTAPVIKITRPTGGFVPASGGIMGSITDTHLTQYKLELTDTPNAPAWTTIASGTSSQVNSTFASLAGRAEGSYLLRVSADDGAQNETVKTVPFVIDNTPPVVKLVAPADGAVVGAAQGPVKVQGTVTDPNLASYTLNIGAGAKPTSWTELITAAQAPADGVLDALDVSKLADGLYTLQLVGKDKAGNTASTSVQITVDNTAPVAAITVPAEGGYVKQAMDITGSATDAHLKSYTLYIAPGDKASASQWSKIGSGTQAVAKGTLLSWGALPPDGVETLRLVVKDAAGNSSEAKVQVTVDTHPPGAPTGLVGKVENGKDVHLTWNANPEPDVAGYNVYRDGKKVTGAPVATPAYVDAGVADGTYQYTVTAVDHAQWESKPSAPAQVVVDTTPPEVRLYVPAAGATVNGLLNVTGTAYSQTDFKEYRLYAGAGANPTDWQLLRESPVPIQNDVLAAWNTVVLPQGATYTLKLEGEDIHGNVATALATVTIDNQPPAAPTGLVAVPNGSNVNLTWNANTEPDLLGYLVYRNDRLANVTGVAVGNLAPYVVVTNSYPDLSLPDGPYTYTIVAMDKAGNTSGPSLPAKVLIDTHPPHMTITVPTDGTKFEKPLYVLATSPDTDIAQVQFQYRAVGATSWTDAGSADTAAPYELTFDPNSLGLAYGDYQLQAVATDTGNKVDPSPTPITVTYADLTPPAPTVGLGAKVNAGDVTLSWTANTESDLAGYYVERTGPSGSTQRITSTPVTGTTFVDTNLGDGAYQYDVVAVDTSGNEAKSSNTANAVVYTPTLAQPYTPTTAATVDLTGQGIGAASVGGQVVTASGTTTLAAVDTDATGKFTLSKLALAPGLNTFTVSLTDAAGNVSKPVSVSVTQGSAPSQPTGVVATASGYDVSVSWNANPESDILGYRIFRDGTALLPDAPATGMTAAASNTYYPASYAVDGNVNTFWAPYPTTTSPVDGQWLSVTLPSVQIVKQVKLQWYTVDYRAVDYDVQAWDGGAWITVAQVRGNTKQVNTVDLAQPYRTDQIRVLLHTINLSLGYYLPVRLGEVGLTVEPVNTTTSFADVTTDGYHTYTVTAVNGYGFESVPSTPVKLAVGDVTPPDPVTLTGTASGSDATLSWTASDSTDVARYDIYRDGKLIGSQTDLSTLSYTDSGLPNGTYNYTVTAVDGAGNVSTPSNQVPVTIAVAVLAAPTNLTVTPVPAGKALDLAWQPGSGAVPTGYSVLRSTTSGGPYTQVGQTTQTTLQDTGLTNGTTYYYVVKALDAVGNVSAPSNEASGTATDTVPPPVSLTYPTVPGDSYLATNAYQDVAGSSEPDATVTLYRNGTAVGTATASHATQVSGGTFSYYTLSPLSPDGRYAAYVYNQALYVHDFDQNTDDQLVSLNTSPGHLSWARGGKSIVFEDLDLSTYAQYLREYNLADGSTKPLTDPSQGNIYSGRLSPDGKHLVASGYHNGQNATWLVDLTDNTWTVLSSDPYYYINLDSFRWSPDSTKVAFLRTSPSMEVEYVDINTGTATVVEPQADYYSWPSWSPDGKSIAYTVQRGSNVELWDYNLAAAAGGALDTNIGQAQTAVFSPDGRYIAYYDSSKAEIEVRDLAAGKVTSLAAVTSGFGLSLQWVRGDYVGFLAGGVCNRIAPAGRFEFKGESLAVGDNVFTAEAADASGNQSAMSAPIIVHYSVANRPDLVVADSDVTILPAAPLAGESTRASVTVHNAGAVASPAASLSLIAVDPQGNSTTLLDGQVLNPIPAGGSQTVSADWTAGSAAGDYTLIAIADPLNALAEVSESNNLGVHGFHVSDNAGASLAVSVAKTSYGANEDLSGSVVVANSGDAFNGKLVVSIEDAKGYLVKQVSSTAVSDLAYGAQLTSPVSWNTGSTFAGSYQIHARLYDASGQLVGDASAPFSLAASETLSGQVSTDQAQYPANSTVHVSGTVHYTGGNTLIDGATARLRVVDANGVVQAEGNTALSNLLPGSDSSVSLDWNTGQAPVGQYTVTLDVLQGAQVTTSASGTFKIVSAGQQLSGTLHLGSDVPALGASDTVDYTLTNTGNEAISQAPVDVELIDPDTQSVVQDKSASVDLAIGAQSTGEVTLDTTGLSLKTYTVALQAKLTQADGTVTPQVLATAPLTVSDHTPPVVQIQSPLAGGFVRGDAPVSVHAVDALTGVSQVQISVDGGAWTVAPPTDRVNSLYGLALASLAEGSHTVQARARDGAGNLGTSAVNSFTVDNTPPAITITGVAANGMYNVNVTPVIAVTDTNLASSHIDVNGNAFVSGTVVSAEGQYHLVVQGTDKAGNTSTQDLWFEIDKTPPVVSISGVSDGGLYNVTITPVVTATDKNFKSLTLTLNGQPYTSGTPIVAEGTYTLVAVAADLAGNTTTQQVKFQIDKTPPAAPTVIYPTEGATLHQRTVDIKGTSEAGATVFLDIGGQESSVLADANGNFTFTQVQLQPGANTFAVHARDRAGNVGPATTVHVKVVLAQLNGQVLPSAGVLVWLPTAHDEHHACDRHEVLGRVGSDHDAAHGRDDRDDDDTPPPSPLEQLIANTLAGANIDYLIVHSEDDFVRALRTQRYGTLMLVEAQPVADCAQGGDGHDEHPGDEQGCEDGHGRHSDELSQLRMRESTRLEIRAMVASGSGIVWVKNQPDEDERWDDIFGARSRGELPGLDDVLLEDGPASTAGDWSAQGTGTRLQVTTGTASGQLFTAHGHDFDHEDRDGRADHDKQDTDPAIVLNAYGHGHAAWFAFDPAQLSDPKGGAQAVLDAVRYAVPADEGPQPGGVSELRWTASKLTPPMDLQFTEDLGNGLSYLYTWGGTVNSPLEAIWEGNVTTDAQVYRALVRVPTSKGAYPVQGKLALLQGGFAIDLVDKSLMLSVASDRDDLGVALMETLSALQVERRDRHELKEAIEHVQRATARVQTTVRDVQASIDDLLDALANLQAMRADTTTAQEQLGALLRVYQSDWSSRQKQ